MGEQAKHWSAEDPKRISASEIEFWAALWATPDEEIAHEWGVDLVRFGPVLAGCVTSESEYPAMGFALGAGEAGAVEQGHLADAVAWLEGRSTEHEERGVAYRVPVIPGLPESAAAEVWLRGARASRDEGTARLIRDASPLELPAPADIEVLDWNEWDDGFAGPLAESLGFSLQGDTFIYSLLGHESEAWSCYCAVSGDDPLAYAAMRRQAGVATLVIGSRPADGREGEGQIEVLRRCIADAAAAGCDLVTLADAGQKPPEVNRESLAKAGFTTVFRVPTWLSQVPVEA